MLILGFFLGLLACWLRNKKVNKSDNLIKQIRFSSGDKALFDLLLPLDLAKLQPFLYKLEANIYRKAKHKIKKSEIINVIKRSN